MIQQFLQILLLQIHLLVEKQIHTSLEFPVILDIQTKEMSYIYINLDKIFPLDYKKLILSS